MAFNDPIAELLTKIRNAKGAQHRYVDMSYSKMKVWILEVLKSHGFVENFLVNKENYKIRVFLRYTRGRESVIHGLTRVSKCGLRRYIGHDRIPNVFNGMGIAIMSTPKGVMDGETAKNLKVGGELLCTVW
ncbi:MAG: 30S ribosomal protein S8 [Chlamydiae bacterium CG10_big_fil_rev_8_21_14_0_10_42_34]|nr:MAG: 30S ribosomal protein S8 [Chlamydiae bacterium CG10_big_fil_rev_8_21_14_0_10_42_34]